MAVGFAEHEAPLEAAPGDDRAVGVGPVIAAAVLVDLRRAAELARVDDERRIEQAALVQIGDQRRKRLIDGRHELLVAPSKPPCVSHS